MIACKLGRGEKEEKEEKDREREGEERERETRTTWWLVTNKNSREMQRFSKSLQFVCWFPVGRTNIYYKVLMLIDSLILRLTHWKESGNTHSFTQFLSESMCVLAKAVLIFPLCFPVFPTPTVFSMSPVCLSVFSVCVCVPALLLTWILPTRTSVYSQLINLQLIPRSLW